MGRAVPKMSWAGHSALLAMGWSGHCLVWDGYGIIWPRDWLAVVWPSAELGCPWAVLATAGLAWPGAGQWLGWP
jgi:hypothetical protein